MKTAPGNNLPIPQIQGSGSLSPYRGKDVTTQGVITAIQQGGRTRGFFLQDPQGDGSDGTSDGIFVSTGALSDAAQGKLAVGMQVKVSGEVSEDFNFTQIIAAAKGVARVPNSRKLDPSALPAAEAIKLPASEKVRSTYLEAREGMLVSFPVAQVMAPTDKFGTFQVVDREAHGPTRDFDEKSATRRLNISGRMGPKAQVVTGDVVTGISGPLGVMFDEYEIRQARPYQDITRTSFPPLMWGDVDGDDAITPRDIQALRDRSGSKATGPQDPADLNADGTVSDEDVQLASSRASRRTDAPVFSIATMNAENFFDPEDAPPPVDDEVPSQNEYNAKLARMAGSIRDKLKFPDMLGMQEVENTRVLDDLISRPELKALGYKYVLLPTTGHRSINPALLYRSDRVSVNNVSQLQTQVPIDDAVHDPHHVSDPNATTGPLFAREPLVVDVTVKGKDEGQKADFTLVVNHLISKFSPRGEPTDPIRVNQARYLNDWITRQKAVSPEREFVVIGDMNDTPDSESMQQLRGTGTSPALADALASVPKAERWSFNFKGASQQIDHILVTPGLADLVERAGVRHYNSDMPESEAWGSAPVRATDHDTPYVWLRFPSGVAADPVKGAALVTPTAS